MRSSLSSVILLSALYLTAASSACAGDDAADKKTVKRILSDMDAVPSFYAKGDSPLKFKDLPKFSATKLSAYRVNKKESVEAERGLWKANKHRYANDHPLRAALFEAAAEMENLQTLQTPTTLQAAELPKVLFHNGRIIYPLDFQYCPIGGTPYLLSLYFHTNASKAKAESLVALLEKQAPAAEAIFKLQPVLMQMHEAAAERDKEKSKRWQANFDFALARVETNLVFLFEYNYTLGQIRADYLPDLGAEENGWQIVARPKVSVTEYKAKQWAKERLKRLRTIQVDHAGTPWAFLAERESERELGMAWVPKKK